MSLDRRDFLRVSAAALAAGTLMPGAAGAAFTHLRAEQRLRLLVLGGTRFLGPAIVEEALARGHEVTLFNRGKSNTEIFQDLEQLRGDRDGQLDTLKGRTWDAVVDTSGYIPRHVHDSATLLQGAVDHYVFISTVSVYGDWDELGLNEESAVATLEDPTSEELNNDTYGALKALCEQAAEAAMPGRVWNVRPGLIVGPRDRSDRFTYWPVRVQGGGEVLAPHAPSEQVQLIDVRDLGEWIVAGVERKVTGVMNADSPPGELSMGELLNTCRAVTASDATFTWADRDWLAEQEVAPWSDLPCWIPTNVEASVGTLRVDRALAAGLRFRPLSETVRDTLRWWANVPAERKDKPMRSGLEAAREAELLAAWHAYQG